MTYSLIFDSLATIQALEAVDTIGLVMKDGMVGKDTIY